MNNLNNTQLKTVGYVLWIIGFTGSHRFYFGKPISGKKSIGARLHLFSRFFFATRLLAWDTPDSQMPKLMLISFNFSLVCFSQRYIFTFLDKAFSFLKTDSTSLKMSCMDTFGTRSFRAGSSLSGFLPNKRLSLINAMKSGLPNNVELTTSSRGLSYFRSLR